MNGYENGVFIYLMVALTFSRSLIME